VRRRPSWRSAQPLIVKRLFDLVGSAIGLTLLSPVFLVVAASIKLSDGGPIFYRGLRVGRHGVLFRVFKFRTMVVDAEYVGGPSTTADDQRVTAIGRVLRKHKIDEIPQLISVLIGDMSLVGPRPEVERYVRLMSDNERIILSVRPGLTDWATLWNSDEGAVLAGSTDPEKTYLELIRPQKIRLQLEYVKNRSFWTDLVILVQTVLAIVLRTKPEALRLREHRQ
jgi:lipopolysaccharide/colanic/teichoic acid biosynthesis glycosyltransferase